MSIQFTVLGFKPTTFWIRVYSLDDSNRIPWVCRRGELLKVSSVTRLVDFWKFFVSRFLLKLAQMYGNFLSLWKHHFSSKKCCGYFLGNFWKLWLFLISTSGNTVSEIQSKETEQNKKKVFCINYLEQHPFGRGGTYKANVWEDLKAAFGLFKHFSRSWKTQK